MLADTACTTIDGSCRVSRCAGGGGGQGRQENGKRPCLQEPLSDSAADQAAQRRVSAARSSGDGSQESYHVRHWQKKNLVPVCDGSIFKTEVL